MSSDRRNRQAAGRVNHVKVATCPNAPTRATIARRNRNYSRGDQESRRTAKRSSGSTGCLSATALFRKKQYLPTCIFLARFRCDATRKLASNGRNGATYKRKGTGHGGGGKTAQLLHQTANAHTRTEEETRRQIKTPRFFCIYRIVYNFD